MEGIKSSDGSFKPGQSGNPTGLPGRPAGSRHAFSAAFLKYLAEVRQEHSHDTMVQKARPARVWS